MLVSSGVNCVSRARFLDALELALDGVVGIEIGLVRERLLLILLSDMIGVNG